MKLLYLFLLSFCLVSHSLFGVNVEYTYIADEEKHASNQKLLTSILQKELRHVEGKSPQEKADYLQSRIFSIAKSLQKGNFSMDAYATPALNHDSVVSFNYFPLWEGEANGAVPLTFFVYIWPSEEYALEHGSPDLEANSRYGSIIHSHPISCAFAALNGDLFQKNYQRTTFYPIERIVRLIDEEKFQKGEGSIDDLKSPFIHQLYSKGTGSKPGLSLHVYGLSSEEKVMNSFRETIAEHSYYYVLNNDGIVQVFPKRKKEIASQ